MYCKSSRIDNGLDFYIRFIIHARCRALLMNCSVYFSEFRGLVPSDLSGRSLGPFPKDILLDFASTSLW